MIVFVRATNEVFRGSGPASGTYGHISLGRLCDHLEATGELRPNETITHLEIVGDMIKYRVEQRKNQPSESRQNRGKENEENQ